VTASLAPIVDAGTIVVVSSDFTHYGPRFDYVPFVDDVPERCATLDLAACSEIARGDARASPRSSRGRGDDLRRLAIEVLPRAPLGRGGGSLLEYDTSGA
jgi:AmmeMemoRadiSam system protein B